MDPPVSDDRPPWRWQGGAQPTLDQPDKVHTLLGLFWPDVIEVEGYIFLADGFNKLKLQSWKASEHIRSHGMRGVAAAINHRHVADLLAPIAGSMSEADLAAIGEAIGRCWRTRLEAKYPGRRFDFELGEEVWFWEGEPPSTSDDPDE